MKHTLGKTLIIVCLSIMLMQNMWGNIGGVMSSDHFATKSGGLGGVEERRRHFECYIYEDPRSILGACELSV